MLPHDDADGPARDPCQGSGTPGAPTCSGAASRPSRAELQLPLTRIEARGPGLKGRGVTRAESQPWAEAASQLHQGHGAGGGLGGAGCGAEPRPRPQPPGLQPLRAGGPCSGKDALCTPVAPAPSSRAGLWVGDGGRQPAVRAAPRPLPAAAPRAPGPRAARPRP